MKRRVAIARRWVIAQAKDLLLLSGVACVAVAASFVAAAGPWLVIGAYLFWTGWTLSRAPRRDG